MATLTKAKSKKSVTVKSKVKDLQPRKQANKVRGGLTVVGGHPGPEDLP